MKRVFAGAALVLLVALGASPAPVTQSLSDGLPRCCV
jgi:hypothetical protein